MHDVSVLHDIVLTLDGYLACLSAFCLRAKGDVVVVFDDFGTYKATLEVRVDNARCLRCFHSFLECPCTALLGTCGEEGLEAEQAICGLDEAVDAALLEA